MCGEIVAELLKMLGIPHGSEVKEVHKVMIIGAVKDALEKSQKYEELRRLLK